MIEKVVGTTYREHPPVSELVGEIDKSGEIPIFTGQALLVPEPTNEYDPNAIAVVAQKKDGNVHHVGYLGKHTELYTKTKNITPAILRIFGYSTIGLTDSFQVETQ